MIVDTGPATKSKNLFVGAIMEVAQNRGLTFVVIEIYYDLHRSQYMQLALFSCPKFSSSVFKDTDFNFWFHHEVKYSLN